MTTTQQKHRVPWLDLLRFGWLIGGAMMPTVFRGILVLAVLILPPVYLAYRPEDFTPLVDTLLSVFLFLLAYWSGYSREINRARQKANDRWLPQAESVIFRLMTLRANVCRFSHTMRTNCSKSECDMPELQDDEMRAVRIKLKADCDASSQRLDDIAHQLEDAIEDWRRFVAANCAGDECSRIFDALQDREQRLRMDMAETTLAVQPHALAEGVGKDLP